MDARPAGFIFRSKATPTHSHLLKYGGRSLDQSLRAHRGRRAHFGGSPHHLRRTISGPAEVTPKPQRIIWIDRWDRHPYLFGADFENTLGKFLIMGSPIECCSQARQLQQKPQPSRGQKRRPLAEPGNLIFVRRVWQPGAQNSVGIAVLRIRAVCTQCPDGPLLLTYL